MASPAACEICHMTNDGTNFEYMDHIICHTCKKKLRLLKEKTVLKHMNTSIFNSYDDYIDNNKEILTELKVEFVKRDIYSKHSLNLARKIKLNKK